MAGVLDEAELRERVLELPGMASALGVLGEEPRCYLVGGAVRDLLLGREPLDIDIAAEGNVGAVAERLAEALGGEVTAHERFGTATVTAGGVDAVNLAQTRRETYPEPGALPEVEPAGLAEDLGRRDFTVNALALGLNGDDAWRLSDPHGGRDDLAAGLIRVLHERSFLDDPTRLLRAARYAARLGFAIEADTERWARAAVAAGALATVSGPRTRDELLDLLAEHDAPAAVELLADLGIAAALHPGLRADPDLVARARGAAMKAELGRNIRRKSALVSDASGAAEIGADPVLTALAALCVGQAVDGSVTAWVDWLGLPAGGRDNVVRAAERAPVLVAALRDELRPSQLRTLLDGEPAEALALALALGAPAEPVRDYVSTLSRTRLEITGADLLAAGLPESPALGRALAETLARKLDGEVEGREDELRTALAIARGGA